ncbi:MAG: hypothetical protein LBS79_07260 [Tannerella sp.]|jgi:hypothetical protein|nr:hypothetical protein [Tannerella sp.]
MYGFFPEPDAVFMQFVVKRWGFSCFGILNPGGHSLAFPAVFRIFAISF